MSKVILYMATSINGLITKKKDDTSWISVDEWNSYSAFVQKAGCLIVGHRTYNILTKQPEFKELSAAKLVVVSHQKMETLSPNHQVASSPKEALDLLSDFDQIVVAGGSILNSSFMQEGLIDEMYLDIEPLCLGKGLNLFSGEDFTTKCQLLEITKITDNIVQLHYSVTS